MHENIDLITVLCAAGACLILFALLLAIVIEHGARAVLKQKDPE